MMRAFSTLAKRRVKACGSKEKKNGTLARSA